MSASSEARCKLCLGEKPLTKEHMPPVGAFKGTRHHVDVLFGEAAVFGGKAVPYQHGFHARVLCEDCNRLTGAWYGGEFTRWTKWGLGILEARQRGVSEAAPFKGHLARVVKQVISTMIASSQPEFGQRRPDLRTFVLQRDATLAPDALRLSVFLSPTSSGRSTGVTGVVSTDTDQSHVLIEFAQPPFGYVLTLDGEPLDPRPVAIGQYAALGFDEVQALELRGLPVLETHLAFPGDYRSRAEIRRDLIVNILDEQGHPGSREEAERIIAAGESTAFLAEHGEDW